MNTMTRKLFGLFFGVLCTAMVIPSTVTAHGIAIIGWGSLIWKPGILEKQGDFLQGGPTLPIAFSRVSSNGPITLVIDPQSDAEGRKPANRVGRDVTSWYARSSHPYNELNEAITNLRKREGSPQPQEGKPHPIGYVNLQEKTFRITQLSPGTGNPVTIRGTINAITQDPTTVDIADGSGIRRELVPYLKGIIAWASRKEFDAAIWTDLQRNFQEKTGQPFNQENAITYVRSLQGEKRELAKEYLERAPVNVLNGTRDGVALLAALT